MSDEYRIKLVVEGEDRASRPIGGISSALSRMAEIAGGMAIYDGLRRIAGGLTDVVGSAVQATGVIQGLEIQYETLIARQIVAAGGAEDFAGAQDLANTASRGLLRELRRLSIISPFGHEEVSNTLRLQMAFGTTADRAVVLTKALTDTAAGLGLTREEAGRLSYNFGQLNMLGRVSAVDLRQLRMVGLDLAAVFRDELGMSVEEVNSALASGQMTMEEVSDAFVRYADENFGGAAARMATTLSGLKSSFEDLFFFASSDLLGPSMEHIGKALGALFEQSNALLESGVFQLIGEELGKVTEIAVQAGESFMTEYGGRILETASAAFGWGAEISAQLAAGLIEGALTAITAAMNFISGLLSFWLMPQSPPRVAPDIDKWGARTFSEFLHGMTEADWGVFNTLSRALNSSLSALVQSGKMGEGAFAETMLNIRQAMATGLVSNTTGGSGILDALSGIGGTLGEELRGLVSLQLELNEATERYHSAAEAFKAASEAEESAKDDVSKLTKEYQRLVAARAPLSQIEAKKAELDAARRNLTLAEKQKTEAGKQLEEAEKAEQALKNQARWQEEIVAQLTEMVRLQSKMAGEEGASGGGKGASKPRGGGGGGGIRIPTPTMPDLASLGGGGAGLEGLKERLREQIVGAFSPFVEEFNSRVAPALDRFSAAWLRLTSLISLAWTQYVKPVVDKIISLIPPELIANIGWATGVVLTFKVGLAALAAVVAAVGAVIAWVSTPIALLIAGIALLKTAWDENWGGIQEITAAAVSWLQEAIPTGLAYIQGVVQNVLSTLQEFWGEHGTTITTIVQGAWGLLKGAFQAGFDYLSAIAGVVLGALQVAWALFGEQVLENISTVWDTLKSLFEIGFDTIMTWLEAFAAAFKGDWYTFGEKVREMWDNAWLAIQTALEGAKTILLESIGTLVTNAIAIFMGTDWLSIGQGIIDGIASGITNGIETIKSAARRAAEAALEAAKGFLGIESPSKEFDWIGQMMMKGWAGGIKDTMKLPLAHVQNATRSMMGSANVTSSRQNITVYRMIVPDVQDRNSLMRQLSRSFATS